MHARKLISALLALAAVLVIATVAAGSSGADDSSGYQVKMHLANAMGLRDGSLVTIGGVKVGTVKVKIDKRDRVALTATFDDGRGPVGRDARAFVSSVNLLGQKRLEIDSGTTSDALPSGSELPASRVTASTDLDQVLQVLSPDVRTRLNILIDELGAAVGGRGADLSKLITTLPPTISKATEVVDRVTGDTDTLASLLTRSDRVVAALTGERRALTRLVDSAGAAAGSVADKRAQLQATLDRAPGTLRTLQSFLSELQQATVPLGPAARDLTKTAPDLVGTMNALAPFRDAASPTLARAVAAAPTLTKLADGATPVLRRAVPTVQRLASVAKDLTPVTDTLDKSVDNLVGTIDNWSRAVQYRDGLSHIFRGEATVTPQTLTGLLGRYRTLLDGATKAKSTKKQKAPAANSTPARPAPAAPELPSLQPVKPTVDKLVKPVQDVVDKVTGLLDDLTGRPPKSGADGPGENSVKSLLDFLLKP